MEHIIYEEKAWTDEEDQNLLYELEHNVCFEQIIADHDRTKQEIERRAAQFAAKKLFSICSYRHDPTSLMQNICEQYHVPEYMLKAVLCQMRAGDIFTALGIFPPSEPSQIPVNTSCSYRFTCGVKQGQLCGKPIPEGNKYCTVCAKKTTPSAKPSELRASELPFNSNQRLADVEKQVRILKLKQAHLIQFTGVLVNIIRIVASKLDSMSH